MTSNRRTILDTGVVVSAALLPGSVPRLAFDQAVGGQLLASEATLTELEEVLRRPKFDRYVRPELRLEFLAALVLLSNLVDIVETIKACRDPKDDKFLEVAVNGKATHLVTGDADLLELNPYRGIAIVTPREYLDGPKA